MTTDHDGGSAAEVSSEAPRLLIRLSDLIAELRALWTKDSDFTMSLAVICRYARQIVDVDAVYALLDDGNGLRAVSSDLGGTSPAQDIRLSMEAQHPAVRAFKTKQTEIVSGNDERFAAAALLAQPVLTDHEPVAVLVFARSAARPFSKADAAEAEVIAREASFAHVMHRRARELRLIYEVTRAINSSLHVNEVLEFIYQGISQILPVDNFYIALLEGSDEIRFEIEIEAGRRLPKRKRKFVGGLTEHLLKTGKPLLLRQGLAAERGLAIRSSGRPSRCWMGAPMVFRDRAVGVIALQDYDRENVYDEAHLSVLENIAGQAAGAIENARMFEQTETSLEQLKMTQQALLQSEKLAAVGQLISGIAHELNNPLTGVVGWTQYLLAQPVNPVVSRHLSTINEQALRASKIVQNLLTFSRQQKPERKTIAVNDVLESTLALRAYELRVNNIAVDRRYCPDLPLVMADSHQLQQVILNLIINAEQAILSKRERGTIAVTTTMNGDKLRVIIADDGPGIAPEMLTRIFDPFFTTKAVGQGTGLGLSISFGIVQEHGGRIWAENGPDGGARFLFELPIARASQAQQPEPEAAATNVGRRRVLVVDDEESVRDLLSIVLEESGLQVELASNGEEGFVKACAGRYDLIVSDLKMPGLDGSAFYEKLRQARPDATAHFLFVTGDVLSTETREFLASTSSQCVLKPFDIHGIKKAVMAALADTSAAAGG